MPDSTLTHVSRTDEMKGSDSIQELYNPHKTEKFMSCFKYAEVFLPIKKLPGHNP
jgi:hypothetical protein